MPIVTRRKSRTREVVKYTRADWRHIAWERDMEVVRLETARKVFSTPEEAALLHHQYGQAIWSWWYAVERSHGRIPQ